LKLYVVSGRSGGPWASRVTVMNVPSLEVDAGTLVNFEKVSL